MLRRTLVFATLASLGCSSGDFNVAGGDDASNSESGDTDNTTSESGSETAIGACDPEADKAKYCIEVKLAKLEHPPYNSVSGATGLGIDGRGRAIVVLWDKDPSATEPGGMSPEPKEVRAYPSGTGEINVDTELPVTVSGSMAAGTYWIASLFADNLTAPREKGDVLPGDFVVLPEVVMGKTAFPKITLETGKVAKATLLLRPNRRISATLGLDASFLAYAKTVPSIHGDGPTMLSIFDGSAEDYSGYLDVGFSKCVATKIQSTTTNAPIIDFTTTVEGEHNVQMALFDYASSPWPGKGTIVTKPDAPYPRVNLKGDSWITSIVVDLVKIPTGPYGSPAPPDTLTCP